MSSDSRFWQGLTWSWAFPKADPASTEKLDSAAKAAWSFALLCASTYLNDRDAANDLMDHALENASGYALRHPDVDIEKLTYRIKSVLRRRAKQLAKRHNRELPNGSLQDLENRLAAQPEIEQRACAQEMYERLSPFAQSVLNLRRTGYSWREISSEFEMDHTAVRRAYFRELESLLRSISADGEKSR